MKTTLVLLAVIIAVSANHSNHKTSTTSKPHHGSTVSDKWHHGSTVPDKWHHNSTVPDKWHHSNCSTDPVKVYHVCDQHLGKCAPPVCARGPNGIVIWFKNACTLSHYNKDCPDKKYTKVDSSKCDPKTKPHVDPKCHRDRLADEELINAPKGKVPVSITQKIIDEIREHCKCTL